MNDLQYWKEYYEKNPHPYDPSSFAIKASGYIKALCSDPVSSLRLIELGCGNGRDSVWFAKRGLQVDAIDQVAEEITYLNDKFNERYPHMTFKSDDFTNLPIPSEPLYDVVYSRFTWHSITKEQELRTINWISHALKPSGLFFLEARSIHDQLYHAGEIISDTESITDHYRRFINIEKLLPKLWEHNMRVIRMVERTGLAVRGDEDPMIVQVVSIKP